MLIDKTATVPEKLISIAKKTPSLPVGIVCAHLSSVMESTKDAFKLGLIEPIFIGKKDEIQKEADVLNWNISNFQIIDKQNDSDAAIFGAQLAKDNKIKVIVK